MEQRKIGLIDRLKDRGFVDQWGFVFFAAVGSVAIVAAKHIALSATAIALGAIGLMISYAFIIARSGSGRLRSDQAGDNCYYLGLIYTLSSLAYAIFFFDPANTATTIVQGFGIALATTVAGLVLRVFFNQGRPDLENVEEMARLELTQAAADLKTELGQVVRTMNDFSRQVRQAIGETRDAATADINSFTTTAIGGLQKVIDTARESLQSEASDFATRTKRYSTAVDRLMTALDRHGDNLDRLNETHEGMSSTLAGLQASAEGSRAMAGDLAVQTEDVGATIRSLREGSEAVAGNVRQVSSMIETMNETVSGLTREIQQQLSEMKSGPTAALTAAEEILREAGRQLSGQLSALAAVHADVSRSISDQSAAALEASRANNSALGSELSRSRELLEKVQSNLTDMTAELLRNVRESR